MILGIGRGEGGAADHFIIPAEDAVHCNFDALGIRTDEYDEEALLVVSGEHVHVADGLADGLLHVVHGAVQLIRAGLLPGVGPEGYHNQHEGVTEALAQVVDVLIEPGKLTVFHVHRALVAAAVADAVDQLFQVHLVDGGGIGIVAIEAVAVLAILLDVIEGLVRFVVDLGIGFGGIAHHDAHGKGGRGDAVDPGLFAFEGVDDGLNPVLGFLCADAGHEEQKFVSTHAATQAIGNVRPEDLTHEVKRPVAGVMAVDVVDDLEVVQVEEGEGAALLAHAVGDGGLSGAAVHQTGEDVSFFDVLGQDSVHDLPEQPGGFDAPVVVRCALLQDIVKHATVPQADENVCEMGIELSSLAVDELVADVIVITGVAVDAVGAHGVEGVRDGGDPGLLRDFLALEPAGVAPAVVALVVAAGHVLRGLDHNAILEDVAAHHGMGFDDVVLHIRQALGIVQYGIWHADLADVVKHGGVAQVVDPLSIPIQSLGNQHRILADTGGVALGVGILGVDGAGKGLYGLEGHLFDLFGAGLGNLRLPGNLLAQLFRVLVFQQYAPVVLGHGDDDESGHAGVEYRKARKKGIRIVRPHVLPERGIENDEEKDGIIEGDEYAIPDADEIAQPDGRHQGPEHRRALAEAVDGVERKGEDAEKRRDQRGPFAVLLHAREIAAAHAAQKGQKGRGEHRLIARDQIDDHQHQPQHGGENAHDRQRMQILPQPFAGIDRPVQHFPVFTYFLEHGCTPPTCAASVYLSKSITY